MKKLRISPALSLPTSAVTSTLIVYGGKGMGKTNLGNVLVEEFARNGLRFAVIDPMGVWWGARYDASGKGKGIKVLILGGIHGDLPISPDSGAMVADMVVDEDASVIVDISRRPDGSMWAISERIRFVRDYAKRIYQRQGEKRRPIHQVVDEAARFAPQIIRAGELATAECMGAIAVLVEEGRNVGIGVTLLTQRSARLNKDVAELADCMIAFRILGPNSMRAVLDWLGEHVEKARLKDISEKLRELPRGSALVVSPGWLEFEGIVAFRKRETFDSSATPEEGKKARVSGKGAEIDLEKYRARFAEVIEEQEANDPKKLRLRVAALEKEVAKKMPNKVVEHIVEKNVVSPAAVIAVERLVARGAKTVESATKLGGALEKVAEKLATAIADAVAGMAKLSATIAATNEPPPPAIKVAPEQPAPRPPKLVAREVPGKITAVGDRDLKPGNLSRVHRAMLTALAENVDGLTRKKLRVHTGYADSGPTSKAMSELIQLGGISDRGGLLSITPVGIKMLGAFSPLPKGDALREFLLTGPRFNKAEKALLSVVCDAWPDALTRAEIREKAGYADSGPTSKAMGKLVNLDYVEEVGRGLRAVNELFSRVP